MDLTPDQYFAAPAACYVRGMLGADRALPSTHAELFGQPLAVLTPDDLLALTRIGQGIGLRLHRFKRTMGLARVARVLGILRGLAPAELLDIGRLGHVRCITPVEAFVDTSWKLIKETGHHTKGGVTYSPAK